MNVRCRTCGLTVQVPAGGCRLCGCGTWLSAEEENIPEVEPVDVLPEVLPTPTPPPQPARPAQTPKASPAPQQPAMRIPTASPSAPTRTAGPAPTPAATEAWPRIE